MKETTHTLGADSKHMQPFGDPCPGELSYNMIHTTEVQMDTLAGSVDTSLDFKKFRRSRRRIIILSWPEAVKLCPVYGMGNICSILEEKYHVQAYWKII